MARNIKKIFFNGEEYPPETFRLAMLLCMVGGFMDTYTFSTRGNVLANAQTGNIVFLAINLLTLFSKTQTFVTKHSHQLT